MFHQDKDLKKCEDKDLKDNSSPQRDCLSSICAGHQWNHHRTNNWDKETLFDLHVHLSFLTAELLSTFMMMTGAAEASCPGQLTRLAHAVTMTT